MTVDGRRGERETEPLPRGAGRQRPPLGPALARTGVPRLRRVRRRADPRPPLPRARCPAGQTGAGARDRQLCRRRAVESSRIAERPSWRRDAAPRSCRSTSTANRSTRRSNPITDLPIAVQRFFFNRALQIAVDRRHDRPTACQSPTQAVRGAPDRLLGAAATARPRRHHRQAQHRALPRRPHVRFADGSEEEIDLVVYCTGYKITFPFFDPGVFSAPDNRMPLYQRVASVESPELYFIGFIQPLGPIMPLAEAQVEWVADLLAGRATYRRGGDAHRDRGRGRGDEEALRRL